MRKSKRFRLAITVIALCVVTLANRRLAADDIVDTAVKAGSFKTLAAALGAAELVDALKGDGPFTVFAPTDEAFEKLPEGTVENLLKPENRAKLVSILTYHVVPGRVTASQVVGLNAATTLNGQRVNVKVDKSKVMIDGANVIKTDIECSNGVIHVIDSVIIPSDENIPATAVKAGNFTTLIAAIKAAGLAEVLSGEGPFTVFAPTDEAFDKLPKGTIESLLKAENRDKLIAILKYHVVAGRVFSDQAVQAKQAKTLLGDAIRVSVKGDQAQINGANLIATDIDTSNGVIHVIDSVLLPPEKAKTLGAAEGRHMIQNAVTTGSRLYNNGYHAACASLYEETARKMMEQIDGMPASAMHSLTNAVHQASQTHCATQRAWTLRHGLDKTFMAMRPIGQN